jgi:hypothetical protein
MVTSQSRNDNEPILKRHKEGMQTPRTSTVDEDKQVRQSQLQRSLFIAWILKDYESERLNLSDPDVFRDITKAVGALCESYVKGLRHRMKV